MQKSASWYLPKWVENLCPHKNLHMDVYSGFIHRYQKLEGTNMFLSKWMGNVRYIQAMEYYSALKRNERADAVAQVYNPNTLGDRGRWITTSLINMEEPCLY